MSEVGLPISFADTAQSALDASKSAGQMLREAREAHGLHVAALAVSLKVPVKKLEALEADRLEDLPDVVFVRALASSVCRALKIDAKPILAKLPQLNTRVLSQAEGGVNVAFRTRADGPAPTVLASVNRPMLFGVLAILLAAIVVMLWPDFAARSASNAAASSGGAAPAQASSNGVSMGNPVNVPSTPVGSGSGTGAISDATTGVVRAVGSSNSSSETATMPALSASPALSTPSVSSPTLATMPLPAGLDAQSVPADSVIVFAASGESWVEVKDAKGRVIWQRTLQSGDKAGVRSTLGTLPFKVTIGRANQTQVSVRGQVFDLVPVTSKDAVARFSVK